MGKSRMAEVEEWLRFTDVFSAWLALIDESYVNELKLCRGYATEINQSTLASAIAARSAKVLLSSAMLCQVGQRAGAPQIGL